MKKKVTIKTEGKRKCDIPNCGRTFSVGWQCYGQSKHVCEYHWNRHCNDNDTFDLFKAFNIPKFRYDKFGFVKARDEEEMKKIIEKNEQQEKESSLDRLKNFKESKANNEIPVKKKVRPVMATALDNVVDDILGNR